LVDSGCTHTGINKKLVKEEKIRKKLMDRSFKIFNISGTKNREVTRFALLELEINRYKEHINVIVTDLNGIDIFLGYNWLVKHNLEINWNSETIQFMRYPKECRIQHQDISFMSKTRKL